MAPPPTGVAQGGILGSGVSTPARPAARRRGPAISFSLQTKRSMTSVSTATPDASHRKEPPAHAPVPHPRHGLSEATELSGREAAAWPSQMAKSSCSRAPRVLLSIGLGRWLGNCAMDSTSALRAQVLVSRCSHAAIISLTRSGLFQPLTNSGCAPSTAKTVSASRTRNSGPAFPSKRIHLLRNRRTDRYSSSATETAESLP